MNLYPDLHLRYATKLMLKYFMKKKSSFQFDGKNDAALRKIFGLCGLTAPNIIIVY